MILTEAVVGSIIRAAARNVLRGKTLAKQVARQTGQTPKQLKFTKVFHGTNTPASAAISKAGFRTDKNVSRQMLGQGVYTSPDNYTATMYAHRAADKFGGQPTLRQLRVPQDVAKKQTTKVYSGTGDYSGKGYKMTTLSTQQANKYDVTDKLPQGVYPHDMMMSPTNRRDLRQRVRRALQNPRAQRVLNRDIQQGNEASLNNLYKQRNNPSNPNTLENELRGRYRGKGVGRKETTTEQIAPLKSNFVGPNLESLPHMDLRGPGQKLKSVINQKKFYDSKWGRLQGGPPKGP